MENGSPPHRAGLHLSAVGTGVPTTPPSNSTWRGAALWKRRLQDLIPGPLRWVVAVCCTALGGLMLVVPQQFALPVYDGLRPLLPWWGLFFLMAGTALVSSAVVPGWPLAATGHGLAALGLLGLAGSLAAGGVWYGVGIYLALGLGTGLAAFLPSGRTATPSGPDLLALSVGIGIMTTGLVVLAAHERIGAPYSGLWPPLPIYGASLFGAGMLLVASCLLRLPRRLFVAFHLLAATVLGGVALGAALPLRAWPAMLIYAGSALGVASLPWTHRLAGHLDIGSLRTRLALALALITAVPLIVGIAVTGEARERAAIEYALRLQQTQAETLAAYVGEYVSRYQAAVAGIAAQEGLLDLPPAEQERRLRALNAVYPEVTGFSTFDEANRPLARSDGRPPTPARDPFVSDTREHGSAIFITISVLHGTPVFAFGSAFRDEDGRYRGMAAGIVENARLTEFLARHGEGAEWRAYLTDGAGRAIAHPDPGVVAAFEDLSATPPLLGLRHSPEASGALRYAGPSGEWLAGYARVPGLGWTVVVERPERAAIAEVHAEREVLFGLLGLLLPLAAVLGWLVAGRLVAPLQALGRALVSVADGGPRATLPHSNVREVQQVAQAFETMRLRLAARTAERDQVEQQLRDLNTALEGRVAERTADLNAALRARDEFLSIASHELRNPLAVLQGITQIMRRAQERGQLDPDRLGRHLTTLHQASTRLATLTDDLLDVSRLQSGQLPLRPQPTDLAQLVREAAERQQIRTATHRFDVQVLGEPCVASVDPERLDQVIANLLENAVKYSPAGGTVEVRVVREDRGLVLRISDHGIGVPPEALEQIFEPFGRAPNAAARHIPGMGLGLYICRRIVEQHGGRIWAESRGDGQGVTMSVWLPSR